MSISNRTPSIRNWIGRRGDLFPLLVTLPALITLFLVIIFPLARATSFTFTDYTLLDPTGDFVFLQNYQRLVNDGQFWNSLVRTIVYAGGSVIIQFVVALGLALLLNRDIRGRNFFRGLFFLPWVIPSVVVAFLAMWVFNGQYGFINFVLVELGLIDGFISWLGSPRWAMFTVVIASSWKGFPFMLVLLLAGLQTIPVEQVEAAKIDGSNRIQRFIHVTLPNIRNIIMLITLLQFVWFFQYITIIWITTRGGPISTTETLPVYIYQLAFSQYNMSYAGTVGMGWLVFLAIFAVGYIKIIGKEF